MDGRWKRWAVAGVLAAGARRVQPERRSASRTRSPCRRRPRRSRRCSPQAFGGQAGVRPRRPRPPEPSRSGEAEARRADEAGDRGRSWPHVDVEAAFKEGRSAAERDQLLDARPAAVPAGPDRRPEEQGRPGRAGPACTPWPGTRTGPSPPIKPPSSSTPRTTNWPTSWPPPRSSSRTGPGRPRLPARPVARPREPDLPEDARPLPGPAGPVAGRPGDAGKGDAAAAGPCTSSAGC